MTVGQREKITYHGNLVRMNRADESFLPAQGIGAGLGEGLGIVLNQVIRGSPSYRGNRVVRQVTGTVVEETAEYVTILTTNGREKKIRVSNIIRRQAI